MESILANAVGRARKEVRGGREYLVADATLIVPGVLAGSKGPLHYPSDELAKKPWRWDGVPLVVGHPMKDGKPVSARHPDVLEKHGIGHIYHTRYDGKLSSEAWFDVEHTRRVDNRILSRLEKGEQIELSTGLDTEDENHEERTSNGKTYTKTARSYLADHVAVLPDGVGACSLHDGCGVFNEAQKLSLWERFCALFTGVANQKPSHDDLRSTLSTLIQERFGGGSLPGMMPACYVVDVYDRDCVYEVHGKLWKIGYSTDLRSGKVELALESPEEVRKVTSYKPITNDQPGENMAKKDCIDWLVANCDCWKGEGDRALLDALPEPKLTMMKATAEKVAALNAAPVPAPTPPAPTPNADIAVMKALVEGMSATVTNLSTTVGNLQQQMESGQNAVLVERLTVNITDPEKKKAKTAELMAMKTDALLGMLELFAPQVTPWSRPPSYLGSSVPATNQRTRTPEQEKADIDAMTPPAWTFDAPGKAVGNGAS